MDIEIHVTVRVLCLKSMPRSCSGTSIFTTPARNPWFCIKVCNCRCFWRLNIATVWNPCGSGDNRCARTRAWHRFWAWKRDSCMVFDVHFHHSHTDSMVLRKSVQLSSVFNNLYDKSIESVWEWWKSMHQNTSVAMFFNMKMWQLHCFRCRFSPLPHGFDGFIRQTIATLRQKVLIVCGSGGHRCARTPAWYWF